MILFERVCEFVQFSNTNSEISLLFPVECLRKSCHDWTKKGELCYKASDERKVWNMTQAACVGMGGILAMPKTQEELTIVNSYFPG